MNKLLLVTIAAFTATSILAAPGTLKTESGQIKGDIKWQRGAKKYTVTHKKNNAVVNAEYALSDVVSLDIEKPANFDKLADMVSRGQGASAIAPLQALVQEYKMLQWDKLAGRYLVDAYLAANNAQKAYETASAIISDDKNAAITGDLAPVYWQTLLKLGKNTQLENCLRKAAAVGDRSSSAFALVMRGDMILASKGESPDACRQALVDAYLRVALMYNDEPCKAAKLSALQKAATCFDKLGMAARAETLRTKAKAL